jgi:hypothetical protein
MSRRAVLEALSELRANIPLRVQLWAGGGASVLRLRAIEGVLAILDLESIADHARNLCRPAIAATPDPGPIPP